MTPSETPSETPSDNGPILIPLDGSAMSEFAVPYASTIAAALGAPILVARIVERTHWISAGSGYLMSQGEYATLMQLETQDAEAQTRQVAQLMREHGVTAQALVEEADLPADLLRMQAREHVQLVVMATHARGGAARAAMGSVADQLVRHGACPTLLVRARGRLPEHPALARALVPLDGSAMSALALVTLKDLAGRLVKEVTLARVIDPDERSGASREALHMLEITRERVERESDGLRGHVETLALWGEATQQILDESARHDLIIMATHGQGGATRWAFGSVASEVLRGARTPLLLMRPQHQP